MEKVAFHSTSSMCTNVPYLAQTHTKAASFISFQFKQPSCGYRRHSIAHLWTPVHYSYPISSQSQLRKYSPIIRSMVDGSVPNLTTDVAVDPTLKVKKRALDVSDDLKGTSIFLLGMTSTLKYNVGKLLADALRYYYFDSDDIVEEAAGGPEAAKSLRENDEKGFHDMESEVLKQLSSLGRLVVCVGNGAVESKTNLAYMRDGISLWIDVPLDMVAREMIQDQDKLTTFDVPASGSFEEVLTQVTALYNELRGGFSTADAKISLQNVANRMGLDDMNAVTGEDVAVEALNQFEKLTRVKKMMEAAGTPF